MNKPVIVVTDPIDPTGIECLSAEADVIDLAASDKSEVGHRDALAYADALIVRGGFQATAQAMDACPNLKLITKHGSGIDNIDVPAATERGICVVNTPGGNNATAVAEGAVMLMLAIQRRVIETNQWVRDGRFPLRTSEPFSDLWGGTVGIIGVGRIGSIVSRICKQGFDMRVLGFDPYVSTETMAEVGAEKTATLPELMGNVDVVTIHTPLTEETRHMVDGKALAAMRPGAILVNTARGPVVDEQALISALRRGMPRAAGIDVFEQEPPVIDNPLFSLHNVVLSPHVAGITRGSMRGMALAVAEVTLRFFEGVQPATLINKQVWNHRRS
jgi:D-3-phosphoglycerate dehydrogenase